MADPTMRSLRSYELESETDLRVLTADLKKQIKEQGRVASGTGLKTIHRYFIIMNFSDLIDLI